MSSENGVPMDDKCPMCSSRIVQGKAGYITVDKYECCSIVDENFVFAQSPTCKRIADLSTSEDRLIKAVTFCIDCCKALEFEMEPWLNGGSANLDMYDTFYRRLGTILDGFPSVLEAANKQANVVGEG